MLKATRTCYGIAAVTNNQLGLSHEIPVNATLNTAMLDPLIVPYQPNVPTLGMETVDPYDAGDDTSKIRIQYLCIGNRGHRIIAGGQTPYTEEVPHKNTDAGLYGLIPFVVKPTDNDLTLSQRQKYRLRKTMLIDGVLYAAYYCRILELGSSLAETTMTEKVDDGNGNITDVTTVFNPTVNNLRPTHPAIGAENDGSYTTVSALVNVLIDANDILLLKEACTRVFGNDNVAIISELTFCTGVEKYALQRYPDTGTQTPTALPVDTYKEVVGLQAAYHTNCYIPAAQFSQGVEVTVDLGSAEPLFGADGG